MGDAESMIDKGGSLAVRHENGALLFTDATSASSIGIYTLAGRLLYRMQMSRITDGIIMPFHFLQGIYLIQATGSGFIKTGSFSIN